MKWVMILFLTFSSTHVFAADGVKDLIEDEKTSLENWLSEDDDLPESYLPGSADAVELYSSAFARAGQEILCGQVEYDELVEDFPSLEKKPEVVLNINLPRVREALEEHCLVRPHDKFLAVGPGEQEWISGKDFVVRKVPVQCPNDSQLSLWLKTEKPVDYNPFFFATDPALKGGENKFQAEESLPKTAMNSGDLQAFKSILLFPDEFKGNFYLVNSSNTDVIASMKRSQVSSDDDGLLNEIVLVKKGDQVQRLMEVPVSRKKGSGHLELVGILDYNFDNFTDILVSVSSPLCQFTVLFKGEEQGTFVQQYKSKSCDCD